MQSLSSMDIPDDNIPHDHKAKLRSALSFSRDPFDEERSDKFICAAISSGKRKLTQAFRDVGMKDGPTSLTSLEERGDYSLQILLDSRPPEDDSAKQEDYRKSDEEIKRERSKIAEAKALAVQEGIEFREELEAKIASNKAKRKLPRTTATTRGPSEDGAGARIVALYHRTPAAAASGSNGLKVVRFGPADA